MGPWILQTQQGELRFNSQQELLQQIKVQIFDLLARSHLAHPVVRAPDGTAYDISIDISVTKVG